MGIGFKVICGLIYGVGVIAITASLLHGTSIPVLEPRGIIAHEQRNLMIIATALMLLIVIPVFALTLGIAWRYRASNTTAKYTPEWDHHRGLETLWWTFPCLIILILAVITWKSSHDLDPFKPIVSHAKPLTIEVVALPWKWLFIYPDQNIATVNYVQFPEKTPIHFKITSDAPMNSFWIPQLGGQVYAMAGMTTQLHLMADAPGSYRGSSANLSGDGFAGMHFVAKSTSQTDFDQWVELVQQSRSTLDEPGYAALAKPSQNLSPKYYATASPGLFDQILMKYMMPGHTGVSAENTTTPQNPSHMHTEAH